MTPVQSIVAALDALCARANTQPHLFGDGPALRVVRCWKRDHVFTKGQADGVPCPWAWWLCEAAGIPHATPGDTAAVRLHVGKDEVVVVMPRVGGTCKRVSVPLPEVVKAAMRLCTTAGQVRCCNMEAA